MNLERTDEAQRGYDQTIRRHHDRTPAQRVGDAVRIKGPEPGYHDDIVAKHRREWPTLWAAIDDLMKETAG